MLDFQAEHLRTFLSVLELGTFDAAARSLHVTASAVSQRIKAMEHTAGQVLLTRTTPITPTSAGESVHKLARQMRQLESDCEAELGLKGSGVAAMTLVVNSDSIATWFIKAIASIPADSGLTFEILREDEKHSAALLRSGAAMAAVTATPQPVQGCSSTPLGAMAYRAVASRDFMARHFPHGFDRKKLEGTPVIQFDRNDTLQTDFFREMTGKELHGPAHYIPDTLQFEAAVRAGLGWGLLPDIEHDAGLASGELLEFVPARVSRVPLFWQRWNIASPALDVLTDAVMTTAAQELPA